VLGCRGKCRRLAIAVAAPLLLGSCLGLRLRLRLRLVLRLRLLLLLLRHCRLPVMLLLRLSGCLRLLLLHWLLCRLCRLCWSLYRRGLRRRGYRAGVVLHGLL
jgi:hypothetical protein